MRKIHLNKLALTIVFAMAGFYPLISQENITFKTPPKEIMELADYERAPMVMLDSKSEYMVLTYRSTYKTLEELNQPELRLAGLRINPVTNISSSANYYNNIKIRRIADKSEHQLAGLPANPQITNIQFSPDDKYFIFSNTTADGVELWIATLADATARKLTEARVNANINNPFTWFRNSSEILVRMLPADRSALIDEKRDLPKGPIVSVGDGKAAQNRTFQDLLKNKNDELNFDAIANSELWKVSTDGKADKFLPAAIYAGESFSPDGNYLMVTTIEKPYSYIVPMNRFPQVTKVYTAAGEFVKTINSVPLTEIMPKGFSAVRTGKRSMDWRSDKPATLTFVEALDGGDPSVKADFRDMMYSWDAPFTSEPKAMVKIPQRYAGVIWGDGQTAILRDSWYETRMTSTYMFSPDSPEISLKLYNSRNMQDVYSDPGSFVTKKNQFGRYTLAIENGKLYLTGDGFTKEGQFPFVDELTLKTLTSKRLYRSDLPNRKEDIVSFTDIKKGVLLVRIESKNEFPNYYFRSLKKGNEITQITSFANPFKSIENVHKEVIKYKRADGIELSGTLYLPAGYDKNKKDKLPLLIWAYPEEFKDAASASQSTQNANQFTAPYYGSFVYWVTRGYAVLDDASFPIVGEGKSEPNDTFIEQLVANAEAAINAVDAMGYIDRNRVAVGGHSYGAFMTANLLTHSKLFAAGIARSGAYNRTLTPFGFQNEQRSYWDAPDVYNRMSPFMNAASMKTPLLLVHGEADNNPGTFTLQTERYFQALKGLGAPVRMVILPKESHSYVTRENIMHLLWEQDQFLEKYLKK